MIKSLTFLIAFIPAFLHAVANLIDAKLTLKHSSGTIMAISGFFSFLIALPLLFILIIKDISIDFGVVSVLILNGCIYVIAMLIYLNVITEHDSSRAVPFFQFIPVFGLCGGYLLLGESMTVGGIVGILILITGGFILAIENGQINKRLAILMLTSALLIASNDLIFAYFGRQVDIVLALFSDLAGTTLFSLGLLIRKRYWRECKASFTKQFPLLALNDTLSISADLCFDYAKIIMPIAIAQAFYASQPVFLLGLIFILHRYYPHIYSEDMSGAHKWYKLLGVVFIFIGAVVVLT